MPAKKLAKQSKENQKSATNQAARNKTVKNQQNKQQTIKKSTGTAINKSKDIKKIEAKAVASSSKLKKTTADTAKNTKPKPIANTSKKTVTRLAIAKTSVNKKSNLKPAATTQPKQKPVASQKTAQKELMTKSNISASKSSTKKTLKQPEKNKPAAQKNKNTLSVPAKKPSIPRIVPTAPRVKLPEFPTTKWGSNLVIHFEVAEQLPPPHLTSIAGGIIFHGEKVVLANVPGRGWEIIGGRIDLDEDPEVTFRRETQKQLGITLSHAKMLGLMRIEHKGPMPPNCPYPYPVAYGVQYIGIMDEMLPFESSVDSLGRSLITMDGLPEHYFGWSPYFEAVFQYAYDEYHKWRKKLKL